MWTVVLSRRVVVNRYVSSDSAPLSTQETIVETFHNLDDDQVFFYEETYGSDIIEIVGTTSYKMRQKGKTDLAGYKIEVSGENWNSAEAKEVKRKEAVYKHHKARKLAKSVSLDDAALTPENLVNKLVEDED